MAKAILAIVLCLCATLISAPVFSAPSQKKPPSWAELTQDQKSTLAPLSEDWDSLNTQRKRKWLGIAKRYPTMKADEQSNVQRRMQDWAKLTAEQRRSAREGFKSISKLPPKQKQVLRDKWEEYQQLPEDERQKLRSTDKPRKPASGAKAAQSTSPAATK